MLFLKLYEQEYESFERYENTSLLNQKTQLELYLDEPKVEKTKKLDILNFWRGNEVRFPELSMMARDVLSIPVSSVASESAFSVGGRVLDQYRSSLKLDVVEAIVCSRD